VVAENREHGNVDRGARLREHLGLLRLAVGGEIARQQHQVGDAIQGRESAPDVVGVRLRAVHVAGGRDAQAPRPRARGRAVSSVVHTGIQLPGCEYSNRTVSHRDTFNALIDAMKIAVAALRDAEVPFVLGGSVAAWATDEVIERADTISVMAIATPVMALEDVLTTMLYALDEHALDYSKALAITRALREQIDWPSLRVRASGSPFAKAFITLVEELRIAPETTRTRRETGGRVRVVSAGE